METEGRMHGEGLVCCVEHFGSTSGEVGNIGLVVVEVLEIHRIGKEIGMSCELICHEFLLSKHQISN